MKRKLTGNYLKLAVIVIALAIASVCALSGTLAAFSATYTWNSQTGEAGEMSYADAEFSLDLFGEGYLLPGGSGDAPITGVDFKDTPVVWSFEVNAGGDRIIPIVFYLAQDGTADITTCYSAYDFSQHEGFVRVGEDVVSTEDISVSPAVFTAALDTGKSVCWAWPDAIYSDAAGETVAEGALADYQADCAEVCDVSYSFTPAQAAAFEDNGVSVAGYVIEREGERLIATDAGIFPLETENGLLKMDGMYVAVERAGRFDAVSDITALSADTAAWLLVVADEVDETARAELAAVGAVVAGSYTADTDYAAEEGSAAWIPSESGNRMLVKLPPVETGVRAAVTVTVSAVVAF